MMGNEYIDDGFDLVILNRKNIESIHLILLCHIFNQETLVNLRIADLAFTESQVERRS